MSTFRLQWTARAREEAVRAVEWYAAENPHAAERLEQEIREVLVALREAPRQWAVWRPPALRRRLLDGFPYYFVYSIVDPDRVILLAFFHQHRDRGRRFPP